MRDEAEAAELAQEVICRCVARGAGERGPLLPYARTVLVNLLRKRWHQRLRTIPLYEFAARSPTESKDGGEDSSDLGVEDRSLTTMDDREFLGLLRLLTRGMPADLRAVCEAHWFGGESYSEIARSLGIAEITARVRCHKGRRLLVNDPVVRAALGYVIRRRT